MELPWPYWLYTLWNSRAYTHAEMVCGLFGPQFNSGFEAVFGATKYWRPAGPALSPATSRADPITPGTVPGSEPATLSDAAMWLAISVASFSCWLVPPFMWYTAR